ncbi:13309_t:CDS:2, partial [Dentiscutata erythropus]
MPLAPALGLVQKAEKKNIEKCIILKEENKENINHEANISYSETSYTSMMNLSESSLFIITTEAAALHCLLNIREHILKMGDTFLVVDFGGGTVDLTMRMIQMGNKLKRKQKEPVTCALRIYSYGELQTSSYLFYKKVKDFEMVDPTIDKIIRLTNNQLEQLSKLPNKRKCKAMLLVVGGFTAIVKGAAA